MGWTLVGNVPFLLTLLIGYVHLVKYLGPRFMRRRKPYEGIKPVIQLYNVSMVLLNIYFVKNFLSRSYLGGGYNFICQGIDFEAKDQTTTELLELSWWYQWVRVADLLDTVFFVLRKEDSHVSFLHVAHHALVVFDGWYGLAYGPDGQVALCIIINSFVHILMYSYYFLTLLGPAVRRHLWWKPYLTRLQLVQFVVVFIHFLVSFFEDCGYPKSHSTLMICEEVFFFFMFARFYVSLQLDSPWELWQPGVRTPRRQRHPRSLLLFASISTTNRQGGDIQQHDTPVSVTSFVATSEQF
ncbi:putative fatty acyl-CoA elongase [Ixodes scapularis]